MAKKAREEEVRTTAQDKHLQKKYEYVVQNKKARQAAKHSKAVKLAAVITVVVLLLATIPFAFYTAVQHMVELNNMKIFVEESGSKVLTLSHFKTMENGSEVIEITGPEAMTNTTFASGKSMAGNVAIEDKFLDILDTDGSFTFEDDYFVAGTFYVQNVTDSTRFYGERIHLDKATLGAEHALRIMVIKEDKINVYATYQRDKKGNVIYLDEAGRRILSDGNGYYYLADEEKIYVEQNGSPVRERVVPLAGTYTERTIAYAEDGTRYLAKAPEGDWMTQPFYDDEYILFTDGLKIEPNEQVKYTIVIWFEGYDDQCVDAILKGEVKISMSFATAE
ncbi:MAG: hypothetical protein ACI4SK_06265 [Christensenellales bacterium]